MKVSAAARKMIEGFEGCRLTAYFDVVGVPTIGYGHTSGVHAGQQITQAEADQILADDLDKVYGPGVLAAIGDVPTTQAQFDAMVSLAFNIGVSGFAKSTVCRMHKAGDYTAAAESFTLWNKAGGRVLEPLTRRRLAEAKLYLSQSASPPQSPALTPVPASDEAMRDAIRSVQHLLNDAGVLTRRDGSKPGLVDGDPGEQTTKALAAWRAAHPA